MLDPTARLTNLRDSVKKFFVDHVEIESSTPVTFDKGIDYPKISNEKIDKWVSVNHTGLDPSDIHSAYLDIYVCTRRDNEGFKLYQLRDLVVGYLKKGRIAFYRSKPNYEDWMQIGYLLVFFLSEGEDGVAVDGTKFKRISVKLKWATK